MPELTTEGRFPSYKDHLNKTFLEEINFNLWVTKGARFNASKRLTTKNEWSNKAMGFLSAYLIIISLFSVYQIFQVPILNPNLIAFSSTGISILLLAYGQMEFAQDYKMRAHSYHECALKLSSLYNQSRAFKTLSNPSDEEKREFSLDLERKYEEILSHYANHDSIDYDIFKASKAQYFELSKWDVGTIRVKYYWEDFFFIPFFNYSSNCINCHRTLLPQIILSGVVPR